MERDGRRQITQQVVGDFSLGPLHFYVLLKRSERF